MPDTPFWKQTPAEGDTASQTPAEAVPTKQGESLLSTQKPEHGDP